MEDFKTWKWIVLSRITENVVIGRTCDRKAGGASSGVWQANHVLV